MALTFNEPGSDIDAPYSSPISTLYSGQQYQSPQKSSKNFTTRRTSDRRFGSTMRGMGAHHNLGKWGGKKSGRGDTSQYGITMPVAPDMAMPSFGDVPAVDEARIRRLTQTRSAAGQRALRSALRENILSASYQDNPNVGAMITRKAMEGFGQGIAETYTRAQQQATGEEYRDRQMGFAKQQAVFQGAMADYMARFGRTTEQYTDTGGGNTVGPMGPTFVRRFA